MYSDDGDYENPDDYEEQQKEGKGSCLWTGDYEPDTD